MKKTQCIIIGLFTMLFLTMPLRCNAFEHVYERKTEEIYATVRYGLAVYEDIGGDLLTYLPEFKGVKVWKEETNWYRVEYRKKGKTRTGWIMRDDFYSDCLIYDGRDKQILADGEYELSYYSKNQYSGITAFHQDLSLNDSFHVNFVYQGEGLFTVMNTENGKYLQPDPLFDSDGSDFWGAKKTAGAFCLIRKGKYFALQDSTTRRYLMKNESGVICFDTVKSVCWKIRRYSKAIDNQSVRVFKQFDAEWADYYYGSGKNEDPSSNTFTTSGCGIFSTVNAIYAVTGMYANPYDLAKYAVKKNYRVMDNGTDSGFFKAAAKEFGDKYGFSYDGSSGSIKRLKKKLASGDVAITHVPGHYVVIASYNKKKKKFLLLDPYHLPKRETNAYGDWISLSDLEDGELYGYEFFFYKAERPEEQGSSK